MTIVYAPYSRGVLALTWPTNRGLALLARDECTDNDTKLQIQIDMRTKTWLTASSMLLTKVSMKASLVEIVEWCSVTGASRSLLVVTFGGFGGFRGTGRENPGYSFDRAQHR